MSLITHLMAQSLMNHCSLHSLPDIPVKCILISHFNSTPYIIPFTFWFVAEFTFDDNQSAAIFMYGNSSVLNCDTIRDWYCDYIWAEILP
ncbi:hypothetical protein EG68_12333 [Paragonimus skrjabini miyazakii]|uniref:Uncharacterized protein n=1 Tax=Paragonimus skrjabini miyazakii TaxID=59628 RepID=A0A8S9YGI5_9TREM|nr:hypothetical protein EG68_12333 [Paragonimus skrjabini miyazakii]